MYKFEKVENYIVIHNEKWKFRILDYKEPKQINIVNITYGNKTNGGYWVDINDYFDDFISQVVFAALKGMNVVNKIKK